MDAPRIIKLLGFLLALAILMPVALVARVAPAPTGARHDRLELETGAGRLLYQGADAASVFIADPKVAEVRPATAGTLFLFGVGPGRTNAVALDAAGQALLDAQVTVLPSSFTASQAEAADAVDRLWQDKVKPLTSATGPSGATDPPPSPQGGR